MPLAFLDTPRTLGPRDDMKGHNWIRPGNMATLEHVGVGGHACCESCKLEVYVMPGAPRIAMEAIKKRFNTPWVNTLLPGRRHRPKFVNGPVVRDTRRGFERGAIYWNKKPKLFPVRGWVFTAVLKYGTGCEPSAYFDWFKWLVVGVVKWAKGHPRKCVVAKEVKLSFRFGASVKPYSRSKLPWLRQSRSPCH